MNYSTEHLDGLQRILIGLGVCIAALGFLIYVSRMPAAPPAPLSTQPVYVDNSRRIEIFSHNFSHNQMCIGNCPGQ